MSKGHIITGVNVLSINIKMGRKGDILLGLSSRSLSLLFLLSLLLLLLGLFHHDSSLGCVILIVLSHSGVDDLTPVSGHELDNALAGHLLQCALGERSSDLQPFRNFGRSDQLVRRDLLVEFVIGILVEQDQVIQLIPGLSLRPLLLLSLTTTPFLLLGGLGGSL